MSNNKRVTMDFNDHASLVASCVSLREQCTELTTKLKSECVYMQSVKFVRYGSAVPVFKVINQERLEMLPKQQQVMVNELVMASNDLQSMIKEREAIDTFNKRVTFWSATNSIIFCANCIAMTVYSLISIFGA